MPQQQADESPADYGPEPRGPRIPRSSGEWRTVVPAPLPRPFPGLVSRTSLAAPVHAQPTTVLIFKDGRPPEKVHNYALTGSTLYALDGDMNQEIPLALLNVPATVESNRAAGVDFALPVSR